MMMQVGFDKIHQRVCLTQMDDNKDEDAHDNDDNDDD